MLKSKSSSGTENLALNVSYNLIINFHKSTDQYKQKIII